MASLCLAADNILNRIIDVETRYREKTSLPSMPPRRSLAAFVTSCPDFPAAITAKVTRSCMIDQRLIKRRGHRLDSAREQWFPLDFSELALRGAQWSILSNNGSRIALRGEDRRFSVIGENRDVHGRGKGRVTKRLRSPVYIAAAIRAYVRRIFKTKTVTVDR